MVRFIVCRLTKIQWHKATQFIKNVYQAADTKYRHAFHYSIFQYIKLPLPLVCQFGQLLGTSPIDFICPNFQASLEVETNLIIWLYGYNLGHKQLENTTFPLCNYHRTRRKSIRLKINIWCHDFTKKLLSPMIALAFHELAVEQNAE